MMLDSPNYSFVMWLLNTARAELEFFATPESVPGGYAILSHVWDKPEQTFQDIQALRARCATGGTNPRDLVHDKVREFCLLAERCGYEWGWADMCCIDKTSSAELSEAIVSMYRYYALADVCYVYLRDVPNASDDELRKRGSRFRESRWHRRGWTLQELIAPSFVVFLSSTWEPLKSKADIADLLEGITRVPAAVLKLEEKPSAYCVAARMSWATHRETTRPEDQAYCLMGLFGIFMPPLYGEGSNAFLRLQEEIMRQVDDPSIFAWGLALRLPVASLNATRIRETLTQGCHDGSFFASAPSVFSIGHRIVTLGTGDQGKTSDVSFWKRLKSLIMSSREITRLPTFNITSYGVMAHLPVLVFSNQHVVMALLLGVTLDKDSVLGLLLRETTSPDPTRPLYAPLSGPLSRRLWELEPAVMKRIAKSGILLEWRTIYILRSSRTPTRTQLPSGLKMLNQSLDAPFHVSHAQDLVKHPPLTLHSHHPQRPPSTSPPTPLRSGCKFGTLIFQWRGVFVPPQAIVLHLGLCTALFPHDPRHWARIELPVTTAEPRGRYLNDDACVGYHEDVAHDCTKHHVDCRPRQTGLFTIDDTSVRVELSFSPHALNPRHVRAVRINIVPEDRE